MFEENINEKVTFVEKNVDRNLGDFNKDKEKITDFIDKRKIYDEENLKISKSMVNGLHKEILVDINLLRGEIQKILNDISDLHNRKTEINEFDTIKNKINHDLVDQLYNFD